MQPKSLILSKSTLVTAIKIVSTFTIFAITVPIFSFGIQANVECTSQLRDEIQSKIDMYAEFEKMLTFEEKNQQNKIKFAELKARKVDPKYKKINDELIKSPKKQDGVTL
jgi:hypothetical protein